MGFRPSSVAPSATSRRAARRLLPRECRPAFCSWPAPSASSIGPGGRWRRALLLALAVGGFFASNLARHLNNLGGFVRDPAGPRTIVDAVRCLAGDHHFSNCSKFKATFCPLDVSEPRPQGSGIWAVISAASWRSRLSSQRHLGSDLGRSLAVAARHPELRLGIPTCDEPWPNNT